MAMQQPTATWPSRVYLPQGIRTWHRVLIGTCATVYFALSVFLDVLLGSSPYTPAGAVVLLAVPQLFVLVMFLDTVVRAAYLEGTVLTVRRMFGLWRRDLAMAHAVRLEQKTLGLRFSAHDGRRWLHVVLRPARYRGPAVAHPLLALADAILAGPPRPEPAAREAWFVAQQLRQLAVQGPAPMR